MCTDAAAHAFYAFFTYEGRKDVFVCAIGQLSCTDLRNGQADITSARS